MSFKDLGPLDLPAIAADVLAQWKQQNRFQQIQALRQGSPAWTFYEGPPSANGSPGIHHVMARAIKDIFCRLKTQQGYFVERKAGWDTHGLPIELQVEKELGIKKEDIGTKISIEDYNARCREAVMRFTAEWNDLTERIGYWVDLDNPYITYTDEYIESLWYLLAKLYDKGLLYKGYTIQPFSPGAGTALSSHELNQPGTYKDVKDTTIVAQFELLAPLPPALETWSGKAVFALAWTTTPWTLPANTALAVGAEIEYALVDSFNVYTGLPGVFIVGQDVLGKYFLPQGQDADMAFEPGQKIVPYRVLGLVKGADLVGAGYAQLMPYIQPEGKAFQIIAGDFVNTSEGTGIVHIAPTFGADDYRVAQQAGIAAIMVQDEAGKPQPIVNRKGQFVDAITDFAGAYVKNYTGADEADPAYRSTDVHISIKLKQENKAFRVEKYEHPYPHCWRTDKPILYYPIDSWFIRTTALKDRLIELNKTIHWKPASTGTGRFGNWLENLVDWNLSRSRFWGTPLPIWRSEDAREAWCANSKVALVEAIAAANASGALSAGEVAQNAHFLEQLSEGIANLHRPYVDQVVLVQNGQKLYREPDLIDVWFDSGAMPYAQQHFPFAGQDAMAMPPNFPADFIAEGVDQTRGWFFTLHAIGTLLFDSVAFKSVVSNGLVLDKDGNKMSKRLGNAVNPFETLAKYGPDATRWYMVGNASPWENLRFSTEGIEEVQRKFFGTLHNTYQFFALYANLDSFTPDAKHLKGAATIDQWLLSRLHTLISTVNERMDDLDPTPAVRAIAEFVTEDLSNWYVRLNRKRFWKGELDDDKLAAYQTLYTALEQVATLMAPFAPFYAEHLYAALKSTELGVHAVGYPQPQHAHINPRLETEMDDVRRLVSLIHSVRKKHQLKVRMPLLRALIPTDTEHMRQAIDHLKGLIAIETNVKAIEVIGADSDLIQKTAKLNFKTAGKKLGPKVNAVAQRIKQMTSEEIRSAEREAEFSLVVDGQTFTLTSEDIELTTQDVPGWIISSDGELTIALDLTLNDELIQEGMARELVNRIQNMRKEAGLSVTDRIALQIHAENQPLFRRVLEQHAGYIQDEVQANGIAWANAPLSLTTEVEGHSLTLELDRVPA